MWHYVFCLAPSALVLMVAIVGYLGACRTDGPPDLNS